MIVIENTESLEVVLEAAVTTTELAWTAGLVQAAGATYEQASSETGATTGTTAVAIVSGTASKQKRVAKVTVYNRDTVSATVVVRRSSVLPMIRAVLLPKWSLHYGSEFGWQIKDDSGRTVTTGEPGTNGTDGSDGALTISETEIDFGAIPVFSKVFTVTDASISSTSEIIAVQSGRAATDKDADENEADFLVCNCTPGSGSFLLNVMALPGPVSGKFKINYQFS
jgi:hypothetical protein